MPSSGFVISGKPVFRVEGRDEVVLVHFDGLQGVENTVLANDQKLILRAMLKADFSAFVLEDCKCTDMLLSLLHGPR